MPRVLILFLLLAGLLQAKPLSVAVNDLGARGVSADEASILGDRLRAELIRTGSFRVMERSMMDQILKEQAFQQSGACEASQCAVEIGKLLSVEKMVVGSVGRIGDLYTLQARILDVRTGEIAFSTSQEYTGKPAGLLSQAVPELARRLSEGAGTKVQEPGMAPMTGQRSEVKTSGAGRTWLRWGSAVGALAAGGYAINRHLEAADQKSKAQAAVAGYAAATSGFEGYKEANATAVRKANAASSRAVIADVAAGVLAGLFTLTFVF